MNISANVKKSLLSFCAVVLGVMASGVAHAQVFLLDIAIVGPNTITITATGSAPTQAAFAYDVNYGIDLLGFFHDSQAKSDLFSAGGTSTLAALNNTGSYPFDQFATDNDTPGDFYQDLNLFGAPESGDGTISFDTKTAAFVANGSLTLNLSPILISSLVTNASGDILAGIAPSNGVTTPDVVIGQWEVVQAPEPSTWLLLAGSVALLPLVRRFRRA